MALEIAQLSLFLFRRCVQAFARESVGGEESWSATWKEPIYAGGVSVMSY
jgi:hypothetical protein